MRFSYVDDADDDSGGSDIELIEEPDIDGLTGTCTAAAASAAVGAATFSRAGRLKDDNACEFVSSEESEKHTSSVGIKNLSPGTAAVGATAYSGLGRLKDDTAPEFAPSSEDETHNSSSGLKDDCSTDSAAAAAAAAVGTTACSRSGRLKDEKAYESACACSEEDKKCTSNGGLKNSSSYETVPIETAAANTSVCAREHSDYEHAAVLQNEKESNVLANEAAARESEALAASIYWEEEAKLAHHLIYKEEEKKAMLNSARGKAVLFVQSILEAHGRLESSKDPSIDSKLGAVATDDMVFLTEKLLELQMRFKAAGKPIHVDIAFHYTRQGNIEQIKTVGLMSRSERRANNVAAVSKNGSAFGDGVYTSNNPFCYRHFGSVGLLVARLKGKTETLPHKGMSPSQIQQRNIDTVVGNKEAYNCSASERSFYNEIVLQQSSQCVPLVKYCSSLITSRSQSAGNEVIYTYHKALQTIVDYFFNGNEITEVKRCAPPLSSSSLASRAAGSATGGAAASLLLGGTSTTPAFGAVSKPSAFGSITAGAFSSAQPNAMPFGTQPRSSNAGHASIRTTTTGFFGSSTPAPAAPLTGLGGFGISWSPAASTLPAVVGALVTAAVAYQVTYVTDGATMVSMHTITAMAAYSAKSPEELRLEDYYMSRKPSVFGSTNASHGSIRTTTTGFLSSSATLPAAPSAGIGGFSISRFPAASISSAVIGALGTAAVPYQLTYVTDGATMVSMHTITAMAAYSAKSPEELRLEDYVACNRRAVGETQPTAQHHFPAATAAPVTTVFGQASALSSSAVPPNANTNASALPAAMTSALRPGIQAQTSFNPVFTNAATGFGSHTGPASGNAFMLPLGAPSAPSQPHTMSSSFIPSFWSSSAPAQLHTSSTSAAVPGAAMMVGPSTHSSGMGVNTTAGRHRGQRLQRVSASRSTPANLVAVASSAPYVLRYVAPQRLTSPTYEYDIVNTTETGEECSICLDDLSTQVAVKLQKCGHKFHKLCIENALSRRNACPICRTAVGEPQGKMPSGKMTITASSRECQGHSCGSIIITYRIRGGLQHPGLTFAGTTRRAYLPDNDDGRRLLKRLESAFMRGLTFFIGTSLSTGQQNVVTWASIHHKTNMSGGLVAHGYPDANYFSNVNQELDSLGVPPAEDC